MLGELFAAHPAVSYLYEPYDLWAAIESATDFLQLYSRGENHCLLGSNMVTPATQGNSKIANGSRLITMSNRDPGGPIYGGNRHCPLN